MVEGKIRPSRSSSGLDSGLVPGVEWEEVEGDMPGLRPKDVNVSEEGEVVEEDAVWSLSTQSREVRDTR